MPETVFHIITEDPHVKHVAQEMNPPCVHEHGSEDRQEITAGVGKEAARNEGPLHNKSFTATQFYKEVDEIHSDQGIS
jgi:hypothetical protein